MNKQLKDLNISIPVIDVLESRKLFGGNGGYGDPPFSSESYGWWQDSEGNWHVDPPTNGGVLDEVEIRPDNPDGGSGNNDPSDQNDDPDNGSSDQDGNNPGNGGQDDDGTNDANDQREDNSDWDQDNANNQPNGGGTGYSGGDGGSTGMIGNPHNLSSHEWGAAPDNLSSNSCVTFAINEILEYFKAQMTSDINAKGTKEYLIQHGDFTIEKLNTIGLNPPETISALDLFFDINKLDTKFTINYEQNSISQTEQDKKDNFNLITNIIEKNHNPVFGMIVVEGRGPHAVVIIGNDGNGNYSWFDPALGITTTSNNSVFYPNGTNLYHAVEITDLDRDYLECLERAKDETNQSVGTSRSE
jgi:hypothetical protein